MDENKVPEAGLELKAENLPAGETTQTEEATPQAQAQEDAAPAAEAGESSTETTHAASAQEPAGQGETEPEVQPESETAEEEKEKPQPVPDTKEGIIARLKEIVANGESISRTEVEQLKQAYYKLHNAAVNAAHEAFIQAGGSAEDFTPPADPSEEIFKAEMSRIRELRTQAAQELEEQKQANLERKLAIIEQIKQMSATPDEADKNYDAVKQLQNEWKEIKLVPAERATELWKNYQHYVDQFYDQLHLNHEFRDYDFKKNLEIKTRLCEAAERLVDVPDPVSAFHQLQKLHQEFRETGPVAKELREALWNRFKEASTAVNKRHQAHFEALKARENENLQQKTALCEQAEAVDTEALKTFADWDKATRHMLELQAQWKTIGFTPKKDNTRIFERFRAACDKFFTQKTAHFKAQRETFQANQQFKNKLCEQAEALSESTDWASTSNKLIARLLYGLLPYGVVLNRFDGGNLRNAIPREAFAIFGVPAEAAGDVCERCRAFAVEIVEEFKHTEPNLQMALDKIEGVQWMLDPVTTQMLVGALVGLPNGVLAMSHAVEGLVETSTNLASVKFGDKGIVITTSQRSSVESAKRYAAQSVEAVLRLAGAVMERCVP